MPRKRKVGPGRPQKRARQRKSRFLSFGVDKSRLKAYQTAAAKGFKSNVSDFLRAAADDLASRLNVTETQLKRERHAFRSGTDDAAEQFERQR
jgi:hypothetical protein